MLVLQDIAPGGLEGIEVFPDHLDPQLLHYLPQALEVDRDALGNPQFFLVSFAGDDASAAEGRLRMSLRYSPLPDSAFTAAEEGGWKLRRADFEKGRLRLTLRSPVDDQAEKIGQWVPALFAPRGPSSNEFHLSPHETQILQDLLQRGQGAVEFDWRLEYQAISPLLPWLVKADSIELVGQLRALLPQEPATPGQVEAAFLSLRPGLVEWVPLETAASTANSETLLRETARRCLPLLFLRPDGQDDLYQLNESADVAEVLRFDLLTPRTQWRSHPLHWSVSDFWASLDEQQRSSLFPQVRPPAPFQDVDIWVVNHLPIDPGHLREVQVDLRYTGPRGAPEFRSMTFDGQGDTESFSTTFVALAGGFELDYRLTAVLVQDEIPRLLETDFATAESTLVDVNRQAAGLDFLQVDASPDLFEKASRLELTIQKPLGDSPDEEPEVLARTTLTAEKHSAWPVLVGVDPEQELWIRCLAFPLEDAAAEETAGENGAQEGAEDGGPAAEDGPETPPAAPETGGGHLIFEDVSKQRSLNLPAYLLEVLEPQQVTVAVAPDLFDRIAFAAVELTSASPPLEGERLFTLEPGKETHWTFHRESIFQPFLFHYRLRYVALDEQGQTLPLTESQWMRGQESELTLTPQSLTPQTEEESQPDEETPA
ncbi:MAG TPA: hypothetical protein VLV83_11430 [Acidobacteriota bacterium]|nr:hypothetical protein [Acidobacteriota bacterium]